MIFKRSRFLLLILILFITSIVNSQNIKVKDVIGLYKMPHSNPEGGQSIAVFPDNTFLSVYFGGFVRGTWEIKGNAVIFTSQSEPEIALYARKLKSLKDIIAFNFDGEFKQGAKVKFGDDKMQLVFNNGANCKSYPYIYKSTDGIKSIKLALLNFTETTDREHLIFKIFNFKLNKDYNDYVIVNLPKQFTTEKKFTIPYNNGLCFSDNKPTKKRSLDSLSNEDKRFFKKYTGIVIIKDVLKYGDELFPSIDFDTLSKKDDSYIKSLLKPYVRIQPKNMISKDNKEIKLKKGSLFFAECK